MIRDPNNNNIGRHPPEPDVECYDCGKLLPISEVAHTERKGPEPVARPIYFCEDYKEEREDQDPSPSQESSESSQDRASREMDRMIENMEREISRLETDYTGEYRGGRTGITEVRESED